MPSYSWKDPSKTQQLMNILVDVLRGNSFTDCGIKSPQWKEVLKRYKLVFPNQVPEVTMEMLQSK